MSYAGTAQQVATITKDAAGIAAVQRTLAVMGSAQTVSDVVCTGTLTLAKEQDRTVNIIIKSKGTQMTRTETTGPKGTTVRIVNHGTGAITNPDGSVGKLVLNNTIAERVSHIPALSLLSEALGPVVKVESQAAADVNGAPNDVIALSYTPDPAHPQLSLFLNITRRLVFIDQATNLVSKIQFTRFSETGHAKHQVEQVFGDYRRIGPLLVPFYQLTYLDGNLETALNLTSAQFNVGLQDAEFALTE
jgi:hypothetical protein